MRNTKACKNRSCRKGGIFEIPTSSTGRFTRWSLSHKRKWESASGLYGDDLPYSEFLAKSENQKGIIEDVLRPGRHAINALLRDKSGQIIQNRRRSDYVEIVEMHDPITIPAGFKGVVTNLAGPIPEDPNQLLVADGFRGVQQKTLDEGTYYLNPYLYRVQPSIVVRNDSIWRPVSTWASPARMVSGSPWTESSNFGSSQKKRRECTVTYNESNNDDGRETDIDQEIIRKVIMPNARAFCRLEGSNSSGRDFIGGETRSAFQAAFQEAIRRTCDVQGIEIVQALITDINRPRRSPHRCECERSPIKSGSNTNRSEFNRNRRPNWQLKRHLWTNARDWLKRIAKWSS